jgi:hypothetical protein
LRLYVECFCSSRDYFTASLAWALLVRPFGAHFKDARKMQEYY